MAAGMKSKADAPQTGLLEMIRTSGAPVSISWCDAGPAGVEKMMRERGSDVLLFCRKPMGPAFPFPWSGYIADLQHKRLPHLFKRVERWHRDRRMRRMLAEAPAVIVNAASVARDIEEFFPGRNARLYALPFCPPADPERLNSTEDPARRVKYNLPVAYFLISNQFWIHKSLDTAFRALRMVRDAGYDVHIVCTGETYDYRWPKHFDNLLALVSKLKLNDRVHILGLIPKADQLAIMRGSLAVIQPTLFEGGPGGGSVYDAVSTGTPALVSDIPVNSEIDLGLVGFFTAASANDLSAKMIGWLNNPPQRPSKDEILRQLKGRQRDLGSLLLRIAREIEGSRASEWGAA